ncbi:hypothetical protein HS041_37790 [Planomonospora sp. ID67723]|uniref:hypothetical protein n=1 Tax=Planomonospora sp. ID67723 TaxID=2738134 RepID=UPI0018C3E9AE|nr:hypothetical protein [Planomonospora sp. ID67723]MBG0833457.1 hypothetical protein [Planomonospora sp. ID67723]
MRRRFSRGVIAIIAIVTVLAVAITVGVFVLINRIGTLTDAGDGCTVTTPDGTLDLEIEQAQVSAAIAGVAHRRKLPERAVVIAYATGIQESKLYNLPFGDRDSVGVFQQRPSQGWGTPEQLLDPVYAAGKFFSALVKVKDYRKIPLHEAAQEVQRSADGSLYAQHEENAKILAAAFTGRVPHAVHCWFPPEGSEETPAPSPAPGKAERELARTLGAGTTLAASSRRRGWLITTWSLAHAQKYGLRTIRYDGRAWSVTGGKEGGWQPDAGASADRVRIS